MKSSINTVIIAIIALGVGLGGGFLLFGDHSASTPAADAPKPTEEERDSESVAIWTCSMHPQIRQNEAGDCAICGMDLILLEENTSNDPLVLEMTPEAVKLANIQTTLIGEKSGYSEKTMRLSGKVQADERLASSQVAHVPGRIEKLFVSFTGEQVRKGQKIATLYSPELITAQRELLEALALQEFNPGLLEAARNKLRYWKIGKAKIESIEQNKSIQETFTVYADKSGIVTNRRVAVGDYVKQGESLFDLMNLQKVWVLFDAYENDLAAIQIGDRVEFTTSSIANQTFKTRVTFIDPMIDPTTRISSIRTEIQNPKGLLKPEMLVYGELQKQSTTASQLRVPMSAVMWTGTRSVVYVKIPELTIPSFQFREIEIGNAQGRSYEVLSGLEFGEEVVTNGSFTIDAAAQLNNQASMMNRNIDVKSENSMAILPDYTEQVPIQFKEQLAEVSDAYLLLKDALVATDAEQALLSSKKINESLARVDMDLVKSEARLYWMQQLQSIQVHSKMISTTNEVEEQRRQFDFLSQALIQTIKVFGVSSDTLYVQHCPMANDNEGADWLSRENNIRNPYFGDKMMRCGLVKTTIDKTFKNPHQE